MATLTLTINETTEADLQRLSAQEGSQASEYASRLFARAVRAARPRPALDPELLKAYTEENRVEEEALADSGSAHRAQLLAQEEQG
ncbi:MAG: hypothetical protein ACRYFS_17065 [Janthinobacterium lividum]